MSSSWATAATASQASPQPVTSESERRGAKSARCAATTTMQRPAVAAAAAAALASAWRLVGAMLLLVLLGSLAPPDANFRLIPAVGAFFIDERQSPQTHEWSYEHQLAWDRQYKSCRQKAQSPIDIQHKHVITSQQLRLFFYNYNRPAKFRLQNAHHTIKMDPLGWAYRGRALEQHDRAAQATGRNQSALAAGATDAITADEYVELTSNAADQQLSSLTANSAAAAPVAAASDTEARRVAPLSDTRPAAPTAEAENDQSLPYAGAPTVKLDWLDDGNNEYMLRDIHFHWGERRDNGSEHAIDGRRAAMEMHLVHIKHGLDKSKVGYTSDSVAVVAVLIESHRKSNADFNPIVNVLTRINTTDEPQDIEFKSINDLLPSNLNSFYTYSGSLTTPPCYQVVNWIVMTERLNMNAKQIEMFRNIYAPPASHQHDVDEARPQLMVPNVRLLQPLNNRTILASFYRSGVGRLDIALHSSSSSSLTLGRAWFSLGVALAFASTSLAFTGAPIVSGPRRHRVNCL